MKSFTQYIVEAFTKSQIAQARANMAKIAKRVMAKANRPVRNTLDWNSPRQSGWWHPTKPAHAFVFSPGTAKIGDTGMSGGNYHLTQLLKYTAKFGLDKQKINDAIFRWMKRNTWHVDRNAVWVKGKSVPSGSKVSDPIVKDMITDTLQKMLTGRIDTCEEMEFLAFDSGWLKVVISSYSIQLDGRNTSVCKANMKTCVREIMHHVPDRNITIMISDVPTDSDYKAIILDTEQKKERFLNS